MSQHVEGGLLGEGQFAIVVARWNEVITSRLLGGAIDTFRRHGVTSDSLTVVHVPGSFEVPLAAETLAASGKYAGVVCLGAVIQGETQHHDYINHAVATGLMSASQRTSVPITFGILTCESMDQALNRAGGKAGNKGEEATLAVIEMSNLMRRLSTK
ncbi:6,7-dimethyl-8-ribityllumazine synthase [bacterium]|uniref:6,7-dimethyl-8-ribityllumazine synthase n=1 Tax=Rubinisphaera brasiliensis (strain ATCC 49424 / DSM 5305 / JCM 21570 / IAM 15109 / NBRC 103401 / IFAM 1448) TaxID=756272 RepID=F0SGU5_RUBBR|nr:6,7-dimethyl-8-ribityllumazine synthase [Rubinisphaera brasiliensis]ADY58380.1 6,7-dimethyl-8-ribityllumazine synthase [Rubinisphaera brasiliensis DSM 5305]MBB02540.1 6,7-dimethyl-8-ribityllumazine synthase [Planctomyces sp.]MBR9803535.1 6,7-dimethyl-8-ribityllumazine synthase [bacterium]